MYCVHLGASFQREHRTEEDDRKEQSGSSLNSQAHWGSIWLFGEPFLKGTKNIHDILDTVAGNKFFPYMYFPQKQVVFSTLDK